jgi:2-oxoglutarate ferredoxin oxidoreductase subunit beta
MDLTVVIYNNYIYGMTGGQYSPTTGTGKFASTAPYGMVESPFDICKLAESAGASFVARITAFHAKQVTRYVQKGMENKGFSVIEVLVPCYTTYGRRNRYRDPVSMFQELKDMTATEKALAKMSPEEAGKKIPIGIFVDNPRPDYLTLYDEVIEKAKLHAKT